MKLERLLEIIIYLLNHEKVSAKYLAEYFKVSVRTIQRDMASIAEAGIPVYTLGGRYGGYARFRTLQNKEPHCQKQRTANHC